MNDSQKWMILQLCQGERIKLANQLEANKARKGVNPMEFYNEAIESNLNIVNSIIEELNTNVNANIN